ncbi:MAG: phosphopantetheine-binding protein [Gammaproteobacteria bacterium]|nr:phosphopantetheine-binding protein [Gammaproteobacteria bacterium]
MINQNKEHILSELQNILVEALRVDPKEITPEARIFSDLGAESIDILDIQFQIERSFGLKLDQNELIENLGEDLSAHEIDEKLTVQWCLGYIERLLQDASET